MDRIGGSGSVDRAGFNQVGPGWAPDTRVERPDYDLHVALKDARFAQPPRPVEPASVPPTETELRQQLSEALKLKAEAETALGRAQAAHDRSEHHVGRCRQRCADFMGLDDAIASAATEALRCSAGMLSVGMSEQHEMMLADRVRAQAELQAAERALLVFRSEYADASQKAGDATKAVDVLVARITAFRAEELAAEHQALLARAATIRTMLVGFDRYVTPLRLPISPSLRTVYGQIDSDTFARQLAEPVWMQWRDAADALRADPMAEVTITPPEAAQREAA